MLRMTRNARRKTRGGLGSALALALALAGGSVIGTAVTGTPAMAQNSEAFAEAYQPVADIVNAEGGDYAGAKARIPAVVAAIETPDDRYAAGNLTLILGNRLTDPVLQRQGLEMMIASGKVLPTDLGQRQFDLGRLAYTAKDYTAARTAFQAAIAAGFTGGSPEPLIAESYFGEGQAEQGLTYLKGLVERTVAAGQPVPDSWLVRGLAVAYKAELVGPTVEFATMLVQHGQSDQRWLQALQVVHAYNTGDPQAELDLLRLMALTNSLTERTEYVTYIEAADPRIMANEVDRVLGAAVAKGVISTGDEYYKDVKALVDQRAAQDRADAPGLGTKARGSTAAKDAINAGDVFLSLGSYAEAEEMYKLALDRAGADRGLLLTRIGIAQVHQSKFADAKATFDQISGPRTSIARMWSAYAASRA